MTFTIVTTADGSLSCIDSETGQLCHNRIGAYTEALKNYAEPCKAIELAKQTGEVRLLDACYGLGYNTWVLADYLLQHASRPLTLSVVAIEKSPEILGFLPRVFEHPNFHNLKSEIDRFEHNIDYRTQWCSSNTNMGQKLTISVADGSRIEIEMYVDDLRERTAKLSQDFDFVFHDAFSAQKMPELWTTDLFQTYARLLTARKGSVITYSAAAAIRGGFIEAGFTVSKTVALGEKNGGTIATLGTLVGEPLNELEQAYLTTRAAIPYRDPGLSNTREQILQQREIEQNSSSRPSGASLRATFASKIRN